jgi:hypothetical protein
MTARTHRGRRLKSEAVRQKFRELLERSLWPHFGSQNGVAARFTNDLLDDMQAAGLRIAERPKIVVRAP